MKSIITTHKESRKASIPINLSIISLLLSAFIILGVQAPLQAQTEDTVTKPSWWFGAAAGANFNFYRGSTKELNANFTPPKAFHDGFGADLYLAPTIEYYRPNTMFGMMLQFGYDGRKGKFDQVYTPCNCPEDLSTKLNYITLEPSLRFAPFKNNFYMFAGLRFAYNIDKSFVYQLGVNPIYTAQTLSPEVTGDLSNVKDLIISMQIGGGIDIPISSQNKTTQFVLSPFISFHPYFGQDPRSIETWNVTTVRAGAALKFGIGKKSATK